MTYSMNVYDSANNLLGTTTKDAIFGEGIFQITFISGNHNIYRVTFGHQSALTAIKEIYYEP